MRQIVARKALTDEEASGLAGHLLAEDNYDTLVEDDCDEVRATDPDFVIPGTVFTTVTVKLALQHHPVIRGIRGE